MVKLHKILTFLFATSLVPSAMAQEAKRVRVGVLGLNNYQAIAYSQLFNDPKATGDLAGLK